MTKIHYLSAAILLASVSIAQAQTQIQTIPPAPVTQGATSIDKNQDANKSNGAADQGLNNAGTRLSTNAQKIAEKRATAKDTAADARKKAARMKKAKHLKKVERSEQAKQPAKIDQPTRIDRPALIDRPSRP